MVKKFGPLGANEEIVVAKGPCIVTGAIAYRGQVKTDRFLDFLPRTLGVGDTLSARVHDKEARNVFLTIYTKRK